MPILDDLENVDYDPILRTKFLNTLELIVGFSNILLGIWFVFAFRPNKSSKPNLRRHKSLHSYLVFPILILKRIKLMWLVLNDHLRSRPLRVKRYEIAWLNRRLHQRELLLKVIEADFHLFISFSESLKMNVGGQILWENRFKFEICW